jgi:ABC-type taurine transport system ATPase subunit
MSRPSKDQVPVDGVSNPERRLNNVVRPDQRRDRAALNLDVLDIDRDDAAEVPAYAGGQKNRIGLARSGHLVAAGQGRAGGLS